jgi:hypothetical protein
VCVWDIEAMELPLDIWAQILNVLTVRDLCRLVYKLNPKKKEFIKIK